MAECKLPLRGHIRNKPTFELGDHVFEEQLALFHTRELQLVAYGVGRELSDSYVEIPVFRAQFDDS